MEPTLVLFSGLPGCGKTTLARTVAQQFSLPLFSKDRVQRVLRDHVPEATGMDGYHLMLDLTEEQLGLGIPVVPDAVFPLMELRQAARQIAARHGARWRPSICCYSEEELYRRRLEERVQYTPGWTPPGWEEVERVRTYYQPWPDGEALTLDAVELIEANFARLVDYLR
jgi:predicted kinase